MVVGGWEGRKGGASRQAASSGVGQPPQDALTWTMGMPAPTLHRLVFLLALLAAAPPATRARAPRPGPGYPSYRGTYPPYSPHPVSRLLPPLQWRWWEVPPRLSPSADLWTAFSQPRSRLPVPMGRVDIDTNLMSQVLEEKVSFGLNYNDVGRIPAPSPPSRRPIPRRFRPSRWRTSQKKIPKSWRRIRFNNKNKAYHTGRQFTNSRHHYSSPQRLNKNRHNAGPHQQVNNHQQQQQHQQYKQGFEPTDVHITLKLPSAVLQPLLTSLPLVKRQHNTRTSATTPEVEIVGLRVQDTDDTNTTVVLSLRDHRPDEEPDIKEEEDREEEEEHPTGGVHSRPKRSYRRRMSYGMNARIRAQMLAHRLSISYRHVQPCSYKDRYYCMNGGTCVFVGALDIKTCRCPIGYTGVRCELIDQEYILSLLTDSIIFS